MWGSSKIIMAQASYTGSEFYHGNNSDDLRCSYIFSLTWHYLSKIMEDHPPRAMMLEYMGVTLEDLERTLCEHNVARYSKKLVVISSTYITYNF